MRNLTTALSPVLFLTLLAVSGCGSKQPKIEPPGVRMVDLSVTPGGNDFELRIRLSNPVPRTLSIETVRFSVRLDGQLLGDFQPDFSGELASLGSEVLTVTGRGDKPVIDALGRLNRGAASRLSIRIDGQVVESGGKTLELDGEGWISPTPGRPWSFR